ncbi:phage integrase Arm DNA-binding domain-containing protein [Parashewanella hymeniacidonis]|uniref:phage integrase Arm DNA-binding domain-containing protein n=1 Tax=Parashewanella hymeniacidonis TaxID=2807618 RepID=UPI001EF5DC10|nr:phage integrase Arm DNA-binding domain-containing protein [Parashewanella hymeniacidonis]
MRKTKSAASLPEHLYYDSRRNTYRIKLVTGKFKSLGVNREIAISIAKEYNRLARSSVGLTAESLLEEQDLLNEQPFSKEVDRLLHRIFQEERPSAVIKKVMRNDADRVKVFFIKTPGSQIKLEHVTEYLEHYHANSSAEVYNRKISWLKKLFSYAIDEGFMEFNPAVLKKKRRLDDKKRKRLKIEWFKEIHDAAPLWLKTAMDLSLQTSHSRAEISRIKYKIYDIKSKTCGCCWHKQPKLTANGLEYGKMYIHRRKVTNKDAANVAIPIGEKLKGIIDRSRDSLVSEYIVHRLPIKCCNKLSKDVKHLTQVSPTLISKTFSKIRDQVGCCNHLTMAERPTFHEIRALSAFLYNSNGVNPQARMAHTDAKSTQIYTKNHIDWVEVPYAEIEL